MVLDFDFVGIFSHYIGYPVEGILVEDTLVGNNLVGFDFDFDFEKIEVQKNCCLLVAAVVFFE